MAVDLQRTFQRVCDQIREMNAARSSSIGEDLQVGESMDVLCFSLMQAQGFRQEGRSLGYNIAVIDDEGTTVPFTSSKSIFRAHSGSVHPIRMLAPSYSDMRIVCPARQLHVVRASNGQFVNKDSHREWLSLIHI